MSNVPFGAETAQAPWNQPDARELPRCSHCGREAEPEYPDQSEADVALPCSDALGRDFCSRGCAIAFAFAMRQRGAAEGRRQSPDGMYEELAGMYEELTGMYEAAAALANLSGEAIGFVAASDDSHGLLQVGRAEELVDDADRPAGGYASRAGWPTGSPQRFVDLDSLRDLGNDLCRLLGGEDDDPKWLKSFAGSSFAGSSRAGSSKESEVLNLCEAHVSEARLRAPGSEVRDGAPGSHPDRDSDRKSVGEGPHSRM